MDVDADSAGDKLKSAEDELKEKEANEIRYLRVTESKRRILRKAKEAFAGIGVGAVSGKKRLSNSKSGRTLDLDFDGDVDMED